MSWQEKRKLYSVNKINMKMKIKVSATLVDHKIIDLPAIGEMP